MQKTVAQYKWEAIGKAISGIKLPTMMNIGNGLEGKNGGSALDQLIQTLTLEKLNTTVTTQPTVKK